MTKQTSKPTAKKAIKAVTSTTSSKQQLQRNVSSQITVRRNKKVILQEKRKEARHRAREWATKELGGKKNGSTSSYSLASTAASMGPSRLSVFDLNEEEEDEEEEEEDAGIDVDTEIFNQRVTKRVTFASGPSSGGRVKDDRVFDPKKYNPPITKRVTFTTSFPSSVYRTNEESIEEDQFFDAMEYFPDDEVGPDDVNVRDLPLARHRSLASKQVRQSTTQPLDPDGFSFSTFVSKPNP